MNQIVHINGGLGKCIMFTAVAKSFKLTYPDSKLVVVSGYPEVFLHNPDIAENFGFTHHGLWKNYYSNPDYEVNAWDPYLHPDWISNSDRHLLEVWCDVLEIDHLCEYPKLYFSGPEVAELQAVINIDKPLLVVQSSGGSNPASVSWTRNPPTNEFNDYLRRYMESYYIVHLCVPETPVLTNVHQRLDGLTRRQAMCLVYYAQNFIGIDSFGMHTRAANPNAGPSEFIFTLPETINRLSYPHKSFTFHTPTLQVKEILNKSCGYYASLSKFAIEDLGESCPIPAGISWFSFPPEDTTQSEDTSGLFFTE